MIIDFRYIPPTFSNVPQSKWVQSLYTRIVSKLPLLKALPKLIQTGNEFRALKKSLGYPEHDLFYYLTHHVVFSHVFLGFAPPRPIPGNALPIGPLLPKEVTPMEPDLQVSLDKLHAKDISVVYVAYG